VEAEDGGSDRGSGEGAEGPAPPSKIARGAGDRGFHSSSRGSVAFMAYPVGPQWIMSDSKELLIVHGLFGSLLIRNNSLLLPRVKNRSAPADPRP